MPEPSRTRTFIEIAGATGVVLSLIFVAMELRHANNLAEAEAVQSINLMIADLLLAGMSDEQILRDSATLNDISMSDARRGFRNAYFLNAYEAAWKSNERGIIDDEMLSVYLKGACSDIFFNSGFDVFVGINGSKWTDARSAFNPRFIEQLELVCTEKFDATK